MIQLKTSKIRYLPPRALKGTTWIPRGPPSLGTCTSFTISLWDNDEWGSMNMYCKQTKTKTKQNKNCYNTDTQQQKRTKRKSHQAHTHTCTHSGIEAWWWERHYTLHTWTLACQHAGRAISRNNYIKMTKNHFSWTTLFYV